MKRYTIAEFRQNTREILNEALRQPVIITRHGDEFVLQSAHMVPAPKKMVTA